MQPKAQILLLIAMIWTFIGQNSGDNNKEIAKTILRSEIEEENQERVIHVTNLVQEFQSQFVLPEDEESVLKQARKSRIIRKTLRKIKKRTGLTIQQILKDKDLLEELKKEFTKTECKTDVVPKKCWRRNPYRTFDGSCNNLANPSWGMAGQLQLRMLDSVYSDGISEPRMFGVGGNPLPSPRLISNTIHKEQQNPRINRRLSVMVMQWGQFLDHDIVSTPTVRRGDGSKFDCCGADSNLLDDTNVGDTNSNDDSNVDDTDADGIDDTNDDDIGSDDVDDTNDEDIGSDDVDDTNDDDRESSLVDSNHLNDSEAKGNQNPNNDNCFSIRIPSDDPHFMGPCMAMSRSVGGVGPDSDISPRQQINRVTSYIDASNVYGSSKEEMKRLKGENGLLRSTDSVLLPKNDNATCITEPDAKSFCQRAGDERVNVNPSLGSLHTLFMQEHNRIASKLQCFNPDWKASTVFNEARKIVAALMQHITYSEYLPVVLGRDTMKSYELTVEKMDHVVGVYDKSRNAGIRNIFSTAAFRFGHSSIPNIQGFMNASGNIDIMPLENTFHRPSFIQERNGKGFKENTKWIISANQPHSDRYFVPAVRNFLFLRNNVSLDLVSLNINRGRDHGLPSYNKWRKYCKLPVAKTFRKLKDHNKETIKGFKKIYRNVNDIDVYSGGVSERHLPGAEVGPLFACLLGEQFKALKKGDRFWYERKHKVTGFTKDQLASIKDYTLAKVICENTGLDTIQRKVMLFPSSNKKMDKCKNLPDLNLLLWKKSDIDTDHC